MKKKRILSVLLAALLALSALTACGSSGSTQTDTTAATEQSTPNGAPPDAPPGGFGGGPGGSSADIDYTAATEITSADTQSGQTYASTTADESALLISTDAEVTVTNPTVTKTGDSDGGDHCNFYGLNAAVLVKDGATVTITGGTISSDASGANAF